MSLVGIFLMLLPHMLWARPETRLQACVGADDQFAYAQSLYDGGAYAEAAVEFKRFIHFFPDDARIEAAWYQVGMAYLHGGRYHSAIQSFKRLIDTFGETPHGIQAHFKISESYLQLKDPGQALIALFNLMAVTKDPAIKDTAFYRAGWIYVEMEKWGKAEAAFEKISPSGRKAFGIQSLLTRMETRKQLKKKDPALAGILAVVPGGGHLYCERYQDALTAFIVNGLLAWAAWEAFDNESPALGSLISVVGLGFYTGSIFGSVSGAHKFNRRQRRQFIETLKNKEKIRLSALFGPKGGALVARFSF